MTEVVEGVVGDWRMIDHAIEVLRPDPDDVDGSYLITDIDAPAWARR